MTTLLSEKITAMMLQELYQKWNEIQKQFGGSKKCSMAEAQERIYEELNILEALRLLNCRTIPGETSDVQVLIAERHRQMEEILQKAKTERMQ